MIKIAPGCYGRDNSAYSILKAQGTLPGGGNLLLFSYLNSLNLSLPIF